MAGWKRKRREGEERLLSLQLYSRSWARSFIHFIPLLISQGLRFLCVCLWFYRWGSWVSERLTRQSSITPSVSEKAAKGFSTKFGKHTQDWEWQPTVWHDMHNFSLDKSNPSLSTAWSPGSLREEPIWGQPAGSGVTSVCESQWMRILARCSCAVLCLVTRLCPTVCGLMDCSPPGCSVLGDSPCKNTGVGCRAHCQGIFPTQGSNPGLLHCGQLLYSLNRQGSSGILEWVADPFSRGSSPTQESNWGLLHCRQILYQLSYKGSPSCSNLKI